MHSSHPSMQAARSPRRWLARLRGAVDVEKFVPDVAVVTVVVTAVLATWMETRPPVQEQKAARVYQTAQALGAAAGCGICGVVASVTRHDSGGYRMRILMDDGSVRVVEHGSSPVMAGSRVMLDGAVLRVVPAPASRG
jgi:hypothetical protein